MNLQTLILKQGTLYDLLFVGKNKEYGAYYNRQVYPEHLKKALLIYFSFIFIVSFSLWGYSRYMSLNNISDEKVYDGPTVFDPYVEIPKADPIIEEPKTTPPIETSTIADVPPKIVDNVFNEKPIETVDNILKSNDPIGSVTNITDNNNPPIQLDKPANTNISNSNGDIKKPEIVEFAEIMPAFPGGEDALITYLVNTIRYPYYARINEIEGTVNIEFVVNEDGSISNVKVLSGINGGCDEEAVRVIKKMPKWSPGMQSGHPVKVYYTVPVTFMLEP